MTTIGPGADPGLDEQLLCPCCWGVADRCGCGDGCVADHAAPVVDRRIL